MKETREKKKKPERKVSMFTIFLWLLLIIAMSVIVITGIYKQNAYEYEIDENLTGIQVTFNEQTSLNHEIYNNVNCLDIYYEKDGETYFLSRYFNDELAGQTIIIPSPDIYLYLNVYGISFNGDPFSYETYGFKIDKIEGYTGEITKVGYKQELPTQCKKYDFTYGYDYPESEHYPMNWYDGVSSTGGRDYFLWEYHFLNDNQNTVTVKVKPEFYDGDIQDFSEEYENIKLYLTNVKDRRYISIFHPDEAEIKIVGNYQEKDQDENYIYQFENVPSGEYFFYKEWMYMDDYYQLIKNGDTNQMLDTIGYEDYHIYSNVLGEDSMHEYGAELLFIDQDLEIMCIDEYYKLSTLELRVKVETNVSDDELEKLVKETIYTTEYINFVYNRYQDGYYIYTIEDELKDYKFLPAICALRGDDKVWNFEIEREKDSDLYVQTTNLLDKDKIDFSVISLEPGENIMYLNTIYSLEQTYIQNDVKWIDENQGLAEMTFSYTSTNLMQYPILPQSMLYDTGSIEYTIYLNEDFCLSSEYENHSDWLIVENYDEYNNLNLVQDPPYIYFKEENIILGHYDSIEILREWNPFI